MLLDFFIGPQDLEPNLEENPPKSSFYPVIKTIITSTIIFIDHHHLGATKDKCNKLAILKRELKSGRENSSPLPESFDKPNQRGVRMQRIRANLYR